MRKTNLLIPLCAVLLFACSDSTDVTGTTVTDNTIGDNTSSSIITSSSSQPTSSSEDSITFSMSTKNGIKFGSCKHNAFEQDFLAKRSTLAASSNTTPEELPKAYMLYNSKGNYQVMLLNVSDYCIVDASVKTTRLGDTLKIEYGGIPNENGELSIAVSTCVCISDHWFDINAKDKDVKFIRFKEDTYEISGDPILVHTRDESDYPTLTDPRDGKTYKTVVIWEQLWMAENLNYEMEDGTQNWCLDNKAENCDKYGRQYTFEAASAACPPGWHLPSDPEWGELLMYNYTEEGWDNFAIVRQDSIVQFWTSSLDTLNNNCHSTTYLEFDSDSQSSPHSMGSCADNENDGLPVRCMKD